MGFPKMKGTLLGISIIRIIVVWGLCEGPPMLGTIWECLTVGIPPGTVGIQGDSGGDHKEKLSQAVQRRSAVMVYP